MLAFLACGDGGGPKESSDPGVFYKGKGEAVRVYPGSQATGSAKTTEDTLTQTYSVSANPADIGRFYTDSLHDWVPVEPIAPSAVAGGQFRAVWEHGNDRLELTTDNPPREAGDNPLIRYTLTVKT